MKLPELMGSRAFEFNEIRAQTMSYSSAGTRVGQERLSANRHGDSKAILHALFGAALEASFPEGKFDGRLPSRPKGRTIVLGAGKAAARMAAAFEEAWNAPCEGLVVTRYGHSMPTRWVRVVEAAHPVPDEVGLAATREILDLAENAGPDDLVVVLISGGASSLLTLPIDGMSLAEKQDVNRQLLRSGAPIGDINCVRKALSAIKGGKLALAAAPAPVVTYLISDVPGDNPAVVGSGPSIVEPNSIDEARAILDRFGIEVPPSVLNLMHKNNASTAAVENEVHLIASPRAALDAAAVKARELGFVPLILGDAIEGEAREVAAVMAGMAQSVRRYGDPVPAPCVLLSGGETTVTVRGSGRGGRNAEFLLSLALHLRGERGMAAIACDTDGIDGTEDNAGAWFDDSLLLGPNRARQQAALQDNDAYTYFAEVDRLIFTGPTLTNVNDFRAILIQ